MKKFVSAILKIIAEVLSFLRLSRQSKTEEAKIKNQEDFKAREKKQQEVTQKDQDEQKISEVIRAKSEEERQKRLEEIRKVISK